MVPENTQFPGSILPNTCKFLKHTKHTQTLPENRRGGAFPNSVYEACIILIIKPDKGFTRKLQSSIHESRCKNYFKV